MNNSDNRFKHSDETVLDEANILLQNNCSYYEVHTRTGVPLSTVAWHMKYRLKTIDAALHNEVMGNVTTRVRR